MVCLDFSKAYDRLGRPWVLDCMSNMGFGKRVCQWASMMLFFFFLGTGKLSTLRQMMQLPNEPRLSPNNGLENAFLSDQVMASNPRKGQAKGFGAKTTIHDRKAGHAMTHVCHRSTRPPRRIDSSMQHIAVNNQRGSVPTVSYGLCSWFPGGAPGPPTTERGSTGPPSVSAFHMLRHQTDHHKS